MALNIADLFEHAVDYFGDRVAVACGEKQLSYAELERQANKLAHYLGDQGVGVGSHVGLYGLNSVELIQVLMATYKLRAVAVNVNYRYSENELRYLFTDADVVALVHDRRYAPLVAAVRPDVPSLRSVVVIDDESDEDFVSYGGVELTDAVAPYSAERDFGERSADDIYMLYTGGTTGYPKGVLWRHEDVWRVLGGGIDFMTGIALADEWAQRERGREMGALVRLCLAPLIHGNAQWAALASLFAGDTVLLVPHFDPDEIWRLIGARRVNVVVLIGDAMARPLIETYLKGDYDASSLIFISSSAALFSPSVKDQYIAALPNVMVSESIGSSETGFAGISFVTSDAVPSDGPRVTPGPQTVVIDDEGRVAAPGVVGRLARGGHVPLGYYKDPVKSATLLTEVDGVRYSMPGDLARLESDGTITLLGRGNTCVNTGGEKVFPEEVEGALKAHPDVFDAIVIGIADDRLGQQVAALIQPRPGRTPDLASVEAHIRTLIAGYKVPRTVWLVEQMSRTPSGKADYAWAHKYAESRQPDQAASPAAN
jgi:3-oxocholest-4-en-26-oate---CoA ligase